MQRLHVIERANALLRRGRAGPCCATADSLGVMHAPSHTSRCLARTLPSTSHGSAVGSAAAASAVLDGGAPQTFCAEGQSALASASWYSSRSISSAVTVVMPL